MIGSIISFICYLPTALGIVILGTIFEVLIFGRDEDPENDIQKTKKPNLY